MTPENTQSGAGLGTRYAVCTHVLFMALYPSPVTDSDTLPLPWLLNLSVMLWFVSLTHLSTAG